MKFNKNLTLDAMLFISFPFGKGNGVPDIPKAPPPNPPTKGFKVN